MEISRREFLRFLGYSSAAIVLSPSIPLWALEKTLSLKPLPASSKDDLLLTKDLSYQVLISWGDPIRASPPLAFGFNNDYIAYFAHPDGKRNEALLWVNHETPSQFFVSGYKRGETKTRQQADKEIDSVGGSIVHIKYVGKKWTLVKDSPFNRRLSGTSRIPFFPKSPEQDLTEAIGSIGNCAGGVTPWGTALTCEEHYSYLYGDAIYDQNNKRSIKYGDEEGIDYRWHAFYPRNPEHYGWVVEVNMKTGEAKKLTALGRFQHEGATVVLAKDQTPVVYMGDDDHDCSIYKFISENKGSLEKGTLYVANIEKGEWLPLCVEKNPTLRKRFGSQTQLLMRTREATNIVGGSKLDRPEDMEVDPRTGAVFFALTNNHKKGNHFGSLWKLEEESPLSLKFRASSFKTGGPSMGFACPDNLCLDKGGNLWFTSDISERYLNKGDFKELGNNSLFVIPIKGPFAGQAVRVASGPVECELTGPCFSDDGDTLFLSVQHPGSKSKSHDAYTSNWPGGGRSMPKPSVVAIQGPLLKALREHKV